MKFSNLFSNNRRNQNPIAGSGNDNSVIVRKKGRLRTVAAACAATVALGVTIGFMGSRVVSEVMYLYPPVPPTTDSSGTTQPPTEHPIVDEEIDRSHLPSVLNPDIPYYNPPRENAVEMSPADLFEALSDTVVGIKLVNISSNGKDDISGIIGSGVVISEEGFIITCAHVIDGAHRVIVVVDDYDDPKIQHEYHAQVYGSDTSTDLAIIKVEREEPFQFAPIGGSSNLRNGQNVVAIGNPLGLVKTITSGIVSGLQRDLGEGAYALPSIQTDAPLNPGNSGGPLFDMYGNVVGIVNLKIVYGSSIDNLGFAISIDDAFPIIEELATNGVIASRPMLGIRATQLTQYNNSVYGVAETSGIIVDSIRPGTPAAESDLSRGDIIRKIDGEEITSVVDVQRAIRNKSIGDMVEVEIIRYDNYGESRTLTISFALTGEEEEQ